MHKENVKANKITKSFNSHVFIYKKNLANKRKLIKSSVRGLSHEPKLKLLPSVVSKAF